MANEVTYTGHPNLFLPAAMNARLHQLLGADEPSLRRLISYRGSVNGTNSLTSKVAKISAADAMAAANADEVTAPANTNLTDQTVNITVARQVLVRKVTDLYQIPRGVAPGVEWMSRQMYTAALLRFNGLLTALFPAIASQAGGGAGVDLTVDDIYDAIYLMRSHRVPGPFNCVLAPNQFNEFSGDLRGETGAIQYLASTAAMLGLESSAAGGLGYEGRWNGVEFFVTPIVEIAGSVSGALFSPDCFGYMDGIPSSIVGMAQAGSSMATMPDGGSIWVELDRHAIEGHLDIVGNMYVGLAEIEDLRGVEIISDDA